MAFVAGLAGRVRLTLGVRPGLSERTLALPLAPDAAIAALRRAHTRPMDFTGKPFKKTFGDPAGADLDESMSEWIGDAGRYARSPPPKAAATRSR